MSSSAQLIHPKNVVFGEPAKAVTYSPPSPPSSNTSHSTPSSPNSSDSSTLSEFNSLNMASPARTSHSSSPANSPSSSPISPSSKRRRIKSNPNAYQQSAAPKSKKTKPWIPFGAIPDAPVFRPTEEQFKDPMKYIASIREKVKDFGICKIIPPSKSWLQNKPFKKVINGNNFIFTTKMQSIDQLQNRGAQSLLFKNELVALGIDTSKIPFIEGQEINLHKLHQTVSNLGGIQRVNATQLWGEVKKSMGLVEPGNEELLSEVYSKYLTIYDLHNPSKNMDADSTPTASSSSSTSVKESDTMDIDEKNEEEEFGYGEGRVFTLRGYHKMANNFKKKYFGMDEEVPPSEIENAYWRIVENSEEPVEVHYGSDLDVSSHGSGFPTDKLRTASGWNLNLFSKLPGSLLHYLEDNIGGVTIPMMYIGMLFSSFCWHTEDNYLYSINYLHDGADKTWYGIPAKAAEDFERVMQNSVPELFQSRPDLLFSLVTLLSPRVIMENQVPIYHTIQHAGEFMLTFPKAYHAGFSHGFNCAESSNFALDDWFPFARECVERYRPHARASVFSVEKLICSAAMNYPDEELAAILRAELPIMKQTEQMLREKVCDLGVSKVATFESFERGDRDVPECCVCKYDCYLSAVACPCSPDKIACLRDVEKLCSCDHSKKTMLYRWKLSDIDDMLERVGFSSYYMEWSQFYFKSDKDSKSDPCKFNSSSKISKPKIRRLARKGGLHKIQNETYEIDEFSKMFVLEDIIDERTFEGELQYLIKWKNMAASKNSWVNAKDFICPGLVDSFRISRNPSLAKVEFSKERKNSSKMRSRMMS